MIDGKPYKITSEETEYTFWLRENPSIHERYTNTTTVNSGSSDSYTSIKFIQEEKKSKKKEYSMTPKKKPRRG